MNNPPTIETDPEASVRYIRLQDVPVAKTILARSDELLIPADCAEDGSVVGIEVVGG